MTNFLKKRIRFWNKTSGNHYNFAVAQPLVLVNIKSKVWIPIKIYKKVETFECECISKVLSIHCIKEHSNHSNFYKFK